MDSGFEGDIEYAGSKFLSNELELDKGMSLIPGTYRFSYQELIIRDAIDKHFEIEQDEYCFDVCMDEAGASLLKNTVEQSFTEKLRSLLIFGSNSRRYKDIFDMYYLKDITLRKM